MRKTPSLSLLPWDDSLLVQALIGCMHMVRLQGAHISLSCCNFSRCSQAYMHQ